MQTLSRQIKELAFKAGFQLVGITSARQPSKSKYLDEWLTRLYHGNMSWMQTRQSIRKDLRLLFPGAKSVICVGHNYHSPRSGISARSQAQISCYGWGKDYHIVMKRRLKGLDDEIKKLQPSVKSRLCIDSAPLMEKLWAEAAGLGWQGKHSILISQHIGTWFFLGEIIVDIELDYDQPGIDHCGTCQACIKACPTGAITKPYVLDASRCISYLTIEYKEEQLPVHLASKMENWIFGCDICQQVCPWNKFKKLTQEQDYLQLKFFQTANRDDLLKLQENDFKNIFKHSPFKRSGFKCFMRNLRNSTENQSGS